MQEFKEFNGYKVKDETARNMATEALNVIEVLGGSTGSKITLLYENPNTLVAFSAQTISLASNDYDLIMGLFFGSTDGETVIPATITTKGMKGMSQWITIGSNYLKRSHRTWFVSDDGLTIDIEGATFVEKSTDSTTPNSTSNKRIIPWRFYGIKL